MAEFYQEVLKWLDTVSGLMKALPVTSANSEAMARMYMTFFTMLQTFVERMPISGAAVAVAPVPAKAPAALPALRVLRPIEIVREAAAMPLPDDMSVRPAPTLVRRAANAPLPETAPAGVAEEPAGEEAEAKEPAKRPVTNKISLRSHGYRLSAKNATRFAALEKARAAHGSDTVAHRLELLKEIWQHHAHPRTAELLHNILCDLAYLREIDRREAEGKGSAAR